MSGNKIKPVAPLVCPQCEAERSFSILKDKVLCRRCGYTQRREDGKLIAPEKTIRKESKPETLQQLPKYGPRKSLKPVARLMYKGELNSWARAAFNTAMSCVHQEKWEEAVEALYRTLETQKDFIDAHFLIAMLVNDPEVKHEHLDIVLALQPNHLEAVREKMILTGKLSADADTLNPYASPQLREAGGAVGTETANLRCPSCGSANMSTDEISGLPVCGSCGQSISNARPGGVGEGMLTMALLERRAKPVQWVIGERLLACNSCGAERTIPSGKLSQRCPFCDSKHVIERDVLESFQQPDGLIPFTINRKQAGNAIKQQLKGITERVRGWFDSNKVERATISAIYLPFWVFDVTAEFHRTITQISYEGRDKKPIPEYSQRQQVSSASMVNVPVCAVKNPAPLLTSKLGEYDFQQMLAYEPSLLSEHQAELYKIDFDKASLEARNIVGRNARFRYGTSSTKQSHGHVLVKHMTFQLALLPVWTGMLYEEDGDVRSVLVNGQTGKVVLGKAKKPRK